MILYDVVLIPKELYIELQFKCPACRRQLTEERSNTYDLGQQMKTYFIRQSDKPTDSTIWKPQYWYLLSDSSINIPVNNMCITCPGNTHIYFTGEFTVGVPCKCWNVVHVELKFQKGILERATNLGFFEKNNLARSLRYVQGHVLGRESGGVLRSIYRC